MKKSLTPYIVIPLLVMILGTGCAGYKLGRISHPQLETIALGDVRNDTKEPYAGTYMKMKLPAALMSDGSLKVVSRSGADAVVHTRIVETILRGKGGSTIEEGEEDQQVFRTTIFSVEVVVAYQVTRRGRETPLIAERTVLGEATFSQEVDLTITRQKAIEVAIAEAARKIAADVTEAW